MRVYNDTELQFVDTFESYVANVLVGNNNAVIPIINASLWPDNPIVSWSGHEHYAYCVDFSYYCFVGLNKLAIPLGDQQVNLHFKADDLKHHVKAYHALGSDGQNYGADICVACRELIYLLPDTSRINSYREPFLPFNTPNSGANMNTSEVELFFSASHLPKEVIELIGENFFRISLTTSETLNMAE